MGAVLAATALAALVLFAGDGGYTVTARFISAGQLVKGNPVQSGGAPIGSVDEIDITDDGRAAIRMSIDDDHAPLRVGTRAQVKQFSQSGIANRYVELTMPAHGSDEIPDGGTIGSDRTTSAVDLDELFNTLDRKTRKALQGFFKGQAEQFRGRGEEANVGLQYLNPALATSSRLFEELSRDQPLLERFLVDSSKLVTALAERRDDLAGLIGHLSTTTGALGSQKAALAESIGRLPPFMRRANTTFVNLRAALDDVDPLVDASKPVARKLGPFLENARAFAHGARPTIRDLRLTIGRRGPRNDLVDYLDSVPRLASIALETRDRSVAPGGRRLGVGRVRGAFPESVDAFRRGAEIVGFARPYTNDFLGWLDDFSTTGAYDALGDYSRASISFDEVISGSPVKSGQYRRCPGGADVAAPDGSNVLSTAEQERLGCTEAHRAAGP
ncbi:MAG TPA: MlaD family protein [Thermoleophilaceae bacterium]|nr:MlaD family protein [Thermoleophilaceae bacterium]